MLWAESSKYVTFSTLKVWAIPEMNLLQHKFLCAALQQICFQSCQREMKKDSQCLKTSVLSLSGSSRLPGPSRVPAAGSGGSRSPGSSNLNRRSQSFNSIDKGKPLQYASGNDRGESKGETWLIDEDQQRGRRFQSPSILNPGHLVAPLTQAGGLNGASVWLVIEVSVYLTENDCLLLFSWLFFFLFFSVGVVKVFFFYIFWFG